jgi:thioredoxin-dependent peroxiredoxin
MFKYNFKTRKVEKWWQEPGMNNDGSDPDSYIETTPENCMEYLSNNK